MFHVQALVAAGRLDEADVCACQASVLLPKLPPDAAGYVASVRGDLALARGDWPAAAAEYAAQAGQAESLRDHNDLVLALQGVVLALGGLARWNAVAELFAIIDDLCAELGISGTVSPERDERLARLRIDAVDAIGESEAVAAAERGRGLRPTERIGGSRHSRRRLFLPETERILIRTGSSAVTNRIRQGRHDRLGTQRHEILGWPEARADPTSGTQRLVSYLVSTTPSGNVRSPPGSGSPTCPGP